MKTTLVLYSLITINWAIAQDKIVDPFPGNSSQLVEQGLKLYPIENGTIKYSAEEQPLDTVIFSFDRFGWRQLTTEKGEKTYYGIKTKVNTRLHKDGIAVHSINLIDMKGITSTEIEIIDLAKYKNPHELLEAQMSRINAKMVGAETILNKDCEVWEYTSKGKVCKLWIWNSLILKDQGAKNTLIAIDLNIGERPSDLLFNLPDGIVWRLPSN